MRARSVLVVGGGPAGLAAAIAAARLGDRAIVCEASSYPRDRVCGEFLSPEIVDDLERLGAGDFASALRPVALSRVLVTSPSGARLAFTIDGPPALGLTRRALEAWLAERARAEGAEVRERSPVRAVASDAGGVRFRTPTDEARADSAIGAFGKRSSLDAALELPRAARPGRFAAVKAYFDAPPSALEADVELHLVRGGYVGLNPVEGNRIGLCALFDGEPTSDLAKLLPRFSRNPTLVERLARLGAPCGATRGLARFGFQAQRVAHVGAGGAVTLLAGDAARLVPSFTGDGNAIAVRTGRLAAEARGDANAYARAFHAELSARFRWAALLHRAFLHPLVFSALAPWLARRPALAPRLYAFTRGRRELDAA
jgi:flavin-dependent dehydrogenase